MALHTRTRGRIGALAVAALALGGTVAAAPASADEGSAGLGYLGWGFKQSFRNYVGNQTAALPPIGALPFGERITLTAPAEFDLAGTPATPSNQSDPNETLPYLLPVSGLSVTDADNLELATAGGVNYHFPSHFFEISLSNVALVVDDGDAQLVADIDSVVTEAFGDFEAGEHHETDVPLADIADLDVDITDNVLSVTATGVTLAAEAAEFLPQSEGEALDNFAVSALVNPVVELSTSEFVVDGVSTVTVSGQGFYHDTAIGTRPPLLGKAAGAYVVVGYFPDVWRPSVVSSSAARPAVSVANGGQKWAIPVGSHASVGGANAGAIELTANGTFTTDLTVSKSVIDAAASAIVAGNYGVYTYPGSGAVAPSFETYSPIEFVKTAPSVQGPDDVTVDDGDTATIAVTATGGDLTYQWESQAPGGAWTEVADATSADITIDATYEISGSKYRVTVANDLGSVTTEAATLSVLPLAPVVTASPSDVSVAVGSSATFAASASGKVVNVQWQSRTGSGAWANVAGATASTLQVATTSVSQSGTQYRVVASNAGGSVESAAATLTVTKAAPVVKVSVKKSLRFASKTKATVTVEVPAGVAAATGPVTIKAGSTVVGKGTLKAGRATVTLTTKLLPGSRNLVAEFAGNADLAAARSTLAKVSVKKAAAKVSSKLAKAKVKVGKRAVLRLKVTGTNVKPAGKVKVTVTKGKKVVRTLTVRVKGGKLVKVKLPQLAKGKYTVKAQYQGSTTVAKKAAKKVTLRVR